MTAASLGVLLLGIIIACLAAGMSYLARALREHLVWHREQLERDR